MVLGGFRWNVLVGFMVRWNSGWSGGFLVDFLSVSGGFCGSSRFSVEFWVQSCFFSNRCCNTCWHNWLKTGEFARALARAYLDRLVDFWLTSCRFLVDFVVLGCFRWNFGWSGGFLVGFWWVLWFCGLVDFW